VLRPNEENLDEVTSHKRTGGHGHKKTTHKGRRK
jgi:hypothetical protein